MALKNQLDKDFSFDLAKNARVIASNTRNNGGQFSATNVNDQMNDTFGQLTIMNYLFPLPLILSHQQL